MSSTVDKIKSYAALPKGWRSGKGVPAAARTIALALRIEQVLRDEGCTETDAFPGEDGTILISGYKDGTAIDVEISPPEPYKHPTI